VQSHWTEATIGENGELVVNGLPFSPGEPVEVLVLSRTIPLEHRVKSMLGSVLEYRDPFLPVSAEDWESMR